MTVVRRAVPTARRAAVGTLGVLALVLLAQLLRAAPAEATSYRYWTYWWGQPGAATWTFASRGPAFDASLITDRTVLGWRFAVNSGTGGSASPGSSPSWDRLCSTAPQAGQNRVAVVVDFGSAADAPPGESPPSSAPRLWCGTLPVYDGSNTAQSNGFAALSHIAGIRPRTSPDGLVCGLDGYPLTECAAVVADPTPTPTPTRTATSHAPAGATATSPRPSPTSGGPGNHDAIRVATAVTATATTATPTAASVESTPPTATGLAPVVGLAPAGQSSPGSASGTLVGGAVVALVAGSAWWTAYRRGRSR